MIMSMCKILCVTNRRLSVGNFAERLAAIETAGAEGIVLREKDLNTDAYRELAQQVQKVCNSLILHTHTETARELGIRRIHLTNESFVRLKPEDRRWFDWIGVSVHSADEAAQVRRTGASCVIAGHIFVTDCKRGVPPRGLCFLKEICRAAGTELPVYAIGGIGPENATLCMQAGAAGICLMSSLMRTENPGEYLGRLMQPAVDRFPRPLS